LKGKLENILDYNIIFGLLNSLIGEIKRIDVTFEGCYNEITRIFTEIENLTTPTTLTTLNALL